MVVLKRNAAAVAARSRVAAADRMSMKALPAAVLPEVVLVSEAQEALTGHKEARLGNIISARPEQPKRSLAKMQRH